MAYLVGVAGFAGAGKTTAVEYLSKVTGGHIIYLGDTVLAEIEARGLPQNRENERRIRIELRERQGLGAFAIPYKGQVFDLLDQGTPVFVDAIFAQEEFELL